MRRRGEDAKNCSKIDMLRRIITGWITHKPNKVTIKKANICLLLLPCDLNVKERFAKKLKTKATLVEMMLAISNSDPKFTSARKTTMSIDVLAMPTRTNRKGLFVNVS
jgi:hypothetical protein